MTGDAAATPRRVLLVSGLSGAGKSSILRVLEDLGHEAVDNPPLATLGQVIQRSTGPVAIGIDVRTSGFDADAVIGAMALLRADRSLRPELLFAVAEEAVLLRRYTATRRRHPLARGGGVADGIATEIAMTAPLRAAADLVIDTSELKPQELRHLIEGRYSQGSDEEPAGLTISLVSFAFPAGLPRESDMVFDARFLRNPFYDPILCSLTGLDADVVRHVEADPDYLSFVDRITELLRLVLPRFVTEGKKYATIAIGCSGGRHRSVTIVEEISRRLALDRVSQGPPETCGRNAAGNNLVHHVRYPIIVTHRELLRAGLPS